MFARTSYTRHLAAVAFAACAVWPAAASAQDAGPALSSATPALLLAAEPLTPVLALSDATAVASSVQADIVPAQPQSRRDNLLIGLYVGHAVVQALDVHSTTRALSRGGVEGNPLLAGIAHRPLALSLVKAGSGAATIYFAEKLRKRSRLGAVLLMVGVNSFYATVVANNYRIAATLR